MPGKRRIFVVGWNDGMDFAMYCDSEPADTVAHWLELIPAALNSQATTEDEKVEVLVPGGTCLLYDWTLEELPADVRVNQVPKPGVVLAVRKGSRLQYEGQKEDSERSEADATGGETAEGGGDDRKSDDVPEARPSEAGDTASHEQGGEYILA